jgi:hypothetical protein
LWKTILDQRPRRGLLGPDPVFAALWQRRVQALLLEPGIRRSGFRCSQCGRLSLSADPCAQCGGRMIQIDDVFDESVHEAISQSAQVRYWKDDALHAIDSIAALTRM